MHQVDFIDPSFNDFKKDVKSFNEVVNAFYSNFDDLPPALVADYLSIIQNRLTSLKKQHKLLSPKQQNNNK